MMCERCWADAYVAALCDTSRGQSEHYNELVKQREACTPKEQAGQWWDDDKEKDSRDEEGDL